MLPYDHSSLSLLRCMHVTVTSTQLLLLFHCQHLGRLLGLARGERPGQRRGAERGRQAAVRVVILFAAGPRRAGAAADPGRRPGASG